MPSALVVQHLQPEEPFAIADALVSHGVELDIRRVFYGDPVPSDASGLDAVVVMGGPMSARSDDGFASRRAELALLEDALARQVPTLGVCLGAQLLAAAAGGMVTVGVAGPEIGWGPVRLAPDAENDPLFRDLPPSLTVLHWHGETYGLPPGAAHLASTERYPNQAFRMGRCAWGLQFHLEVGVEAVAGFTATFGAEARSAGVDPAAIDAESARAVAELEGPRGTLLERFADIVGARAGTTPGPKMAPARLDRG